MGSLAAMTFRMLMRLKCHSHALMLHGVRAVKISAAVSYVQLPILLLTFFPN